ncbi:MAG: hypothetical protein IMZ44_14915, partial [Planctomycetes bacterium]|nr:hypothetical protein [Planctomycetota bacterium]
MRATLFAVAVLVLLVSAVPAAAPVNLDEPVVVTKAMLVDLVMMTAQKPHVSYRYDPGTDTVIASFTPPPGSSQTSQARVQSINRESTTKDLATLTNFF